MKSTTAVDESSPVCLKNSISAESFLFPAALILFFGSIGAHMGVANMLNTLMNTAYALLTDTVFYIMAISVLSGAFSALLDEFGVVSVLNYALSPLMKPLYGMPGASVVGALASYLSDNPAILTTVEDPNTLRFFKKYQVPALTNLGSSFGMGLIVTTFMLAISSSLGESTISAVIIGNLGAVIGSVVSTRLLLHHAASIYGKEAPALEHAEHAEGHIPAGKRIVHKGGIATRFMEAMLEGGKRGVSIGFSIIPGVLFICSLVMLLSNGSGEVGYTGSAYEGIALIPFLGQKLSFLLKPLFGLSSPELIAVPLTSLGAASAALGLIPKLISQQLVTLHDICVFTGFGICAGGYLSTHIAMMDNLHYRSLAGKAVLYHTIGSIVAGWSSNILYTLLFL